MTWGFWDNAENTLDHCFKCLALVHDKAYNSPWLVANADEINRLLRTALNIYPQTFHYCVDLLTKIFPAMLTSAAASVWHHRFYEALLEAQNRSDHDLISRLSLSMGRYYQAIGSPRTAEVLANQAKGYVHDDDAEAQLQAHILLITLAIHSDLKTATPDALTQAAAWAEATESDPLRAQVYQALAELMWARGEHDLASKFAARATDIVAITQDVAGQFRVLIIQAAMLRAQGDVAGAHHAIQGAKRLLGQADSALLAQDHLLIEEALLLLAAGELHQAEQRFKQALAFPRSFSPTAEQARCYAELARLYLDQARLDEAAEAGHKAEALWRALDNGLQTAHALFTLAEVVEQQSHMAYGFDLHTPFCTAWASAQQAPDSPARASLLGQISARMAALGIAC